MKKVSLILLIIITYFFSLNVTLAYYSTSGMLINKFFSEKYNLRINSDGGVFNTNAIYIKNNGVILPTPTKTGYDFFGYVDEQNIDYSTNVSDVSNINNKILSAKWNPIVYSINYNLNGGSANTIDNYTIESNITLPTPTKKGYTFAGWTGTDLNTLTKDVTIKNRTGDRYYTANWIKNYYTVNYYVNNSLWTQRSVGFGDAIPNLNGQDALDSYHKFHGWNGWISNMPDYDVNLNASVTEAYCQLITGHGPYGNASALLNVFQSAGWTGHIYEATTSSGNYLVVTDYTLTRAQAENQKNYIAAHTNYTNYNFPYLYWVAIQCSNGYSSAWTRSRGQSSFN